MSIEARFLDFMASVGLAPAKFYPVADDRIHRFRVEGDKLRFVLVADDNYETPGNPGLTEATRAAYMAGGWLARPDLSRMEKA